MDYLHIIRTQEAKIKELTTRVEELLRDNERLDNANRILSKGRIDRFSVDHGRPLI